MGHRAHGNMTRIHGRLLSKATGLMSTTVCSSVAHSRNTSCCESHAHFTGMVDPKASLTTFQAHRTKEVLSPTRTFDFNDSRLDAHYVTMTSNLKVSRA